VHHDARQAAAETAVMFMSAAARPLPPEARERLSKLVLMLSSSNDGERANAAAMIDRLLKSNGCDWHDFVGMLQRRDAPAPPPPPPRPAPSSWQRTTGPTTLGRYQLLDLLDIVEDHSPFLPIKSAEFLDSLRQRARIWPTVRLSEKQWKWLQDLIERTGV
jgi:hypothetical protein